MRRALLTLALVLAAALLSVPVAHAGQWIQVSCQNPDGSSSNSEGWTGSAVPDGDGAGPYAGSAAITRCDGTTPMSAELLPGGETPNGAAEQLEYQPPAGSTLIGGVLQIDAQAEGGSSTGSGNVYIYSPSVVFPGDVIYQCAEALANCVMSPHDYTGPVGLPADAGGGVYVQAECGGAPGGGCTDAGPDGAISLVNIHSAQLTLSNTIVPTGQNFTGTLLGKNVGGVAQLLFTASAPGGPGVYSVTATIDGAPVYSATPNTNDGACVAVGNVSGTLMFDHQQPCPTSTAVAIPVNTALLPDGSHELTVSVTDAAGNVAIVDDQTITTSNPVLTPKPRRGDVKARFSISWKWAGPVTHLRSIKVRKLPRNGRVSVFCQGAHCPRLKLHTVPARHVERLLKSLAGKRLIAGDRLLLTVTQPHHRAERVALSFQTGAQPIATLLSARKHKKHKKR